MCECVIQNSLLVGIVKIIKRQRHMFTFLIYYLLFKHVAIRLSNLAYQLLSNFDWKNKRQSKSHLSRYKCNEKNSGIRKNGKKHTLAQTADRLHSKMQHIWDMRFIYNLAPQEDAVKYLC